MNYKSALILAGIVVTILIIGGTVATALNDKSSPTKSIVRGYRNNAANSLDTTTTSAAVDKTNTTQNDMLVYLIEEEKLAHDVYTVMYQKYGSNVFNNIAKSETNHQARVLSLLNARAIKDPRKTIVGSFENQDLQHLYNKLVQQGSQSVSEAYKVGVAIEELDISDIDKQLATATDGDIINTLNSLKKASQSHLKAFERQAAR